MNYWDEIEPIAVRHAMPRCGCRIDSPRDLDGVECGRPAIALWRWENRGHICVCRHHDRSIKKNHPGWRQA